MNNHSLSLPVMLSGLSNAAQKKRRATTFDQKYFPVVFEGGL